MFNNIYIVRLKKKLHKNRLTTKAN